jgi:hypothetical protein
MMRGRKTSTAGGQPAQAQYEPEEVDVPHPTQRVDGPEVPAFIQMALFMMKQGFAGEGALRWY